MPTSPARLTAEDVSLTDGLGRLHATSGVLLAFSPDILPADHRVSCDCANITVGRTVVPELISRDVFVRMPGVAPLDRCIRVSAGAKADLDVFEATLPGALMAAQ